MKKWLLLLSLATCVLSSKAQCQADSFPNTPKLTVKGTATVYKPADQMEINLGVATGGEDSNQATETNNRSVKQILSNLKALGLDESDIKTGKIVVRHIEPGTIKASDGKEEKTPPYEALNTIQVITHKTNLAEQIIHAAIEGGANQIARAKFSLNNPQSYREGAIKLAAQNATSDAIALAAATEMNLKRILTLSLDQYQYTPQVVEHPVGQEPEEGSIQPGQNEISATVTLTYEIGS